MKLAPVNSNGAVDVSRARMAGVSGDNGGLIFSGGGWVLAPNEFIKFLLPTPFIGAQMWGRVACKDAPTDPTCANYTCSSASGSIPTGCTLVEPKGHFGIFEIHFGKTGMALDFYGISQADSYNLPITIVPVPSSYAGATSNPNRTNSCGSIVFASHLNKNCPAALSEDGSGSSSCITNENSLVFKNACPGCYSFSYDDATSTYVCRGADYQMQFGVVGEKAFYIPL
ncbi:hypothetical protein WJX81_004051 [Elliptochloris bilobata]|uniref:Thaumatin-like protein n=1 Tax=Elliptochloris bilobata TaxID=381761 RepID=A0AAW1SJY3_9CHLO